MFYSSNSANPFSQIPPSLHLPPHLPPFLGHDGPSIFLQQHPHQHQHHHHPDLLPNDSGLANLPFIDPISGIAISDNARTTNPQINGHHFSPQINVLPSNKKGGKKDRHTKIRTAQGSRDRRVRLSIEIARKFFDLQDTLGFDRASKTIDWLLTKSTNAIKELMLMKHSCSGSDGFKSLFSHEVELSGTNIDGVDYNGELQGIVSERMERNVKVQDRVAFHLLSRESKARARARERARERTREKMSTKKLINNSEEVVMIPDSSIPIFNGPFSCSKVCHGIRSTGLIEEDSFVIKRKQSSILSDLENLSKSVASSPTIPKNLDTIGTTTFPSFYAITNMNLLPEFQMTSKPWEACTSHCEC